jgi:uncharacterized protein (DUF1697 family)
VRWVGFVRNVMLGREGVDRALLVTTVLEAGATDARSHLATGNVTFEVRSAPAAGLVAHRLEEAVGLALGRDEMVAVRELAWLRDLVTSDPFAGLDADEWAFEVAFLRHDSPAVDPARLPDAGRTVVVRVQDRELLTARPRSGGGRPHVNTMLQRATGLQATSRGWSTLHRLAEKG